MKLAVSFSGGKDSLVVLHQALKRDPSIPVVFVDTTVSLPETLDYVKDLADNWGLNLFIFTPDYDFWYWLEKKQIWPTKNHRWCMTKLKLPAFKKAVERLNLDGFITGLRRFESLYRAKAWGYKTWNKQGRYWLINPIWNWRDQDVENYIIKHGLPVNPAYSLFGTTSCWFCPFHKKSEIIRIFSHHPEFAEKIARYEKRFGAAFYFGHPTYVSDIICQKILREGML